MKFTNKKRGFTIVELIIVIAVIAVLAAVLIPVFSGLIQQGKDAEAKVVVNTLNKGLAMSTSTHKTMQSALEAVETNVGINVAKLNETYAKTGNQILWDSKIDSFLFVNGDNRVYAPEVTDPNTTKIDLWAVATTEAELSTEYSNYWYGSNVSTFTVSTGFDAGTSTDITSVKYENKTSTAKDVVIRTNGGTLTVNAPSDIVKHYGYAEVLDVQAVDFSTSYHEYGASGFARVAKGHFVVEGTGTVNVLYATGTKTGDTAVKVDNNNGIIGKAFATDDSVANGENNVPTQDGNIILVKNSSVTSEIITAVTVGNIAETLATNDTLKEIVANNAFRGEGTEESPYLISNANELKLYQEKVNQGLYCASTVYFKLTNDVDISIYEWTPIGVETSDGDKQYNGHFDGNNKTISGLTMSTGTARIGLFGIVYAPTIENVKLSGVSLNGEKRIGALVGQIKGNATITNCAVDSKSKIVGSDANVGGLIGEAVTGTEIKLSNLINEAEVIADGKADGRGAGIIAQVSTNAVVTITNCINNGKISAKYAGGIVSAYQNGSLTIDNCTNNGILEGTYTGKILGWMTSVQLLTIKNYSGEIDGSLLGAMDKDYERNISINNVSYFMNKLTEEKKFADMWNIKETLDTAKMDRIIDFYKYAKTKNDNFKDYSETYWSLFQANVGFGGDGWPQLLARYNQEKFQNESEYLTADEFSSTAWRNVDLYVVGQ